MLQWLGWGAGSPASSPGPEEGWLDDDYDPRKPEYITPATPEEVERNNGEILRKQINKLETHFEKRKTEVPSWSRHDDLATRHYKTVIDDLRTQAATLNGQKGGPVGKRSHMRMRSEPNFSCSSIRTNECDEQAIPEELCKKTMGVCTSSQVNTPRGSFTLASPMGMANKNKALIGGATTMPRRAGHQRMQSLPLRPVSCGFTVLSPRLEEPLSPLINSADLPQQSMQSNVQADSDPKVVAEAEKVGCQPAPPTDAVSTCTGDFEGSLAETLSDIGSQVTSTPSGQAAYPLPIASAGLMAELCDELSDLPSCPPTVEPQGTRLSVRRMHTEPVVSKWRKGTIDLAPNCDVFGVEDFDGELFHSSIPEGLALPLEDEDDISPVTPKGSSSPPRSPGSESTRIGSPCSDRLSYCAAPLSNRSSMERIAVPSGAPRRSSGLSDALGKLLPREMEEFLPITRFTHTRVRSCPQPWVSAAPRPKPKVTSPFQDQFTPEHPELEPPLAVARAIQLAGSEARTGHSGNSASSAEWQREQLLAL